MQLECMLISFNGYQHLGLRSFVALCVVIHKSRSKSRGYVYINPQKQTHFNYKCHNCGYNNTFILLKDYVPALYNPLKKDIMVEYLS